MKIYIMSRTIDGEIKRPKVSRDASSLRKEMEAEYNKILKDAGHLGLALGLLENGDLVAYYGRCRHVWRIDEIICQSCVTNYEPEGITMKKFKVEVVETYRRYVEVEAQDKDAAYQDIEDKINNGEIDLPCDGEDYKYDRELFVSEVKEENE